MMELFPTEILDLENYSNNSPVGCFLEINLDYPNELHDLHNDYPLVGEKKVTLWCSGYHYCTASFNKAWTQILCRFKSCPWCVGDSRWWGSLTVVPARNKVKRLSSVNHATKTIHHHHVVQISVTNYKR